MLRSRSLWAVVPLWLASACAGSAAGHRASAPRAVQPATCSKLVQADLGEVLRAQLASATDVLSFEAAWKLAHPGAAPGSISRAAVVSVIRARADQIRGCYEAALDRLPDNGRGKVIVRFVIDASGHVPAAALAADELGVPELACCLAERVTRWTFPAPSGGDFVVVEYPFSVQISKS